MNKGARGSRWRHLDWEAAAGIIAAVAALVLHLLHIVDVDVLLIIIMVLLALLLVRDLHREGREERLASLAEETSHLMERLAGAIEMPETTLIGPRQLRDHSDRFARNAKGEMVWFNVCLLMFRPQVLFDSLLRPAIENPNVSRIRFILDPGERERWEQEVLPKANACEGKEKLLEPHWAPLNEAVSFILADFGDEGGTEAQLSFWGEPFMARSTTQDVPRYIFHVHSNSALIPRLVEMERNYRMQSPATGA